MDGVIANFIRAALKLHFGSRWEAKLALWPKGDYFGYRQLGLLSGSFWKKITEAGANFWANLPMYPWTSDLIEMCRGFGSVCLLSAPSRHPSCVEGKLRWIQAVFGERFRDYIFAPSQHKKLLAAPNRYLIEDSEQNAEEFVAAGGGGAVIVPRLWNSLPELSTEPVEAVAKKLGDLTRRRIR
jgi:hypothetical protein